MGNAFRGICVNKNFTRDDAGTTTLHEMKNVDLPERIKNNTMGILMRNNAQITLINNVHKYICVNIRKNIDLLKNKTLFKCKLKNKT